LPTRSSIAIWVRRCPPACWIAPIATSRWPFGLIAKSSTRARVRPGAAIRASNAGSAAPVARLIRASADRFCPPIALNEPPAYSQPPETFSSRTSPQLI
jgi:hypothetical protein